MNPLHRYGFRQVKSRRTRPYNENTMRELPLGLAGVDIPELRAFQGPRLADGSFVSLQNENFPEDLGALYPDELKMMMKKRARYTTAPVAQTSSVSLNQVQRGIVLSGKEYIGPVTGSLTFGVYSQLLRPTDYSVFSWLGQISTKFEEYKFLSLKFVYEPQCSTQTTGSVGIYFDGDPTHGPPASWNNFINLGASVHGAPWAPHVLNVPAHLFRSRKSYYTKPEYADANLGGYVYTNAAITPSPTDPLEYYPGTFGFVATEQASTATCGKVYLEYTIQLKSQNVEGYSVTSLGGSLISSEIAQNSGNGCMVVQKVAFSTSTEHGLLGGTLAAHMSNYTYCGDAIIQIPAQLVAGYCLALQDVEVLVHVDCRTAGTVNNALRLDSWRNNQAVGAIVANQDVLSGASIAHDATHNGVRSISSNPYAWGGALFQATSTFMLKLEKGDRFILHATTAAGVPFTYCVVTLTPMTFGINV